MSATIRVIVNGDAVDVPKSATMSDLFAQLDLDAKWVVAEHNGAPVPRARTAVTILRDGDRVELVKAVAGG